MTWNQVVELFLKMVAVIKSLNPAYRQPGDGSDGTCDCIGLIIGAIRRMKLKWTGIHGSNWAARNEFEQLKEIKSVSDLELGDVVLKHYKKGEKGWTLDKYPRYLPGGKYYNGDLNDYYHAGVVTHVNPLNITHMSSKMTVDTKLGKWSHHGKLNILIKAAGGTPTPAPAPSPEPAPIPSTGSRAIVNAANGYPVKMRQYPSTSCGTYDKLDVGTEVEIVAPGEKWAQINGGRRKGWYMMSEFLDIIGDGKGKY